MVYRILGVGLTTVALAIGVPSARGDEQAIDAVKTARVKAAFLLNFARFVSWPDGAFGSEHDPLVIGVLGSDPFAAILGETLQGKSVGGRALVARRLSLADAGAAEALRHCHVLYLPDPERRHLNEVTRLLTGAPVLIVGEGQEFAAEGGMIAFVLSEGKIAFHINQASVERSGLKASAKLLQLARFVHSEKR